MDHEKYEREIEFKEFVKNFLANWKKVLLITLVCSLTFGGYKLYTGFRAMNDGVTAQAQNDQYNTAIEKYETDKNKLQSEIDILQNTVDYQNEYTEQSVLMKINPYNEFTATIGYYIEAGEQNSASQSDASDIADSVIGDYSILAQGAQMYDYVSEKLSYDLDSWYLREIITLESDYDANMFYINVVNADQSSCEEIANIINDYITLQQEDIDSNIGAFNITKISDSVSTIVNTELAEYQISQGQLITGYTTQLRDKKNALAALPQPVLSVLTKGTVLKSAIKYAILGFLIGLFLLFLINTLIYIFSDKLLDRKIFKQRYQLGGIYTYHINKYKKDKKLQNEDIENLAVKLELMLRKEGLAGGKLCLTGSVRPEVLSELCKKLQGVQKLQDFKFDFGPNVCKNLESLTKLNECIAVILVEEMNVSRYSDIDAEFENIHDLDKKVIGSILIQ